MSDLVLAPPSFEADGKKFVFCDFRTVAATLILDVATQKASVRSRFEFDTESQGRPLFDLREPILEAKIDGADVSVVDQLSPEIDQEQVSYKAIDTELLDGAHICEVAYDSAQPIWTAEGVTYYFSFSDLESDNGFLERYFPSNLEFDHFSFSLDLELRGTSLEHTLITNGNLQQLSAGRWKIEFPSYFTSSSFYLHLAPTRNLKIEYDSYLSCDGRMLETVLYTVPAFFVSQDLSGLFDAFGSKLKESLATLEARYGPFPYSKVIVWAMGGGHGGMEYAGATSSRLSSLFHELSHSYFARCVMPRDGSAGWVDEAIAEFNDSLPEYPTLPERESRMGNHSPYRRRMDPSSYDSGLQLLGHIHWLLRDREGLVPVLRVYFERYKYQSVSARDFQKVLESVTGRSFYGLFEVQAYGAAERVMVPPPPPPPDTLTLRSHRLAPAELRRMLEAI